MTRRPYDAHLCAADPAMWEAGFNFARVWYPRFAPPGEADRIHAAIRDSTGRPWNETAALLGYRPTPFVEGLALGVYGLVGLERMLP